MGLLGNGDADTINSQLLNAFHKVSSDRVSREAEEEVCGHLALYVLSMPYLSLAPACHHCHFFRPAMFGIITLIACVVGYFY